MLKKDLITKWLSLFGNTAVFSLNDISSNNKVSKGNFNWSKYHDIDTYIQVNEESPYGLFFTPNGNLGKVNNIGYRVIRGANNCDGSVYAFYIDIDIKDTEYTSIGRLKEVTLNTIKKDKLPVSYMVESGGGLHLYMFVDPDDSKRISKINFKKIQEEFASRFEGGDLSSHSHNKLMRLPFSNHWKTMNPIPLKLYSFFNEGGEIEVNEVNKVDDIIEPYTYLPYEYLINLDNNIKENTNIKITMSNPSQQKELNGDIIAINKLDVTKVIQILDFKNDVYRKSYLGNYYRFFLDGNRINIEITDSTTGEVYDQETSGYRVNTEENYVHNFSFDNHPIEERPRGGTFSFLYHYFDKNIGKVKKFLESEFGLILKQQDNFGYLNIKTYNGVIVFSKDGVFYNKDVKKGDSTQVIQKTLFEIPIQIMGVFSSKYTAFGEAEHLHNYYMIKRLDIDDNNEVIVNFNVDRKSFNKTFGSTGLVFFGSEEDMLSFYSALNKASTAGQIPTLDFEYLNGFKKDKLILGNNIYDKDFNRLENTGIILKTQKIDMNYRGKEECSVSQFASKLREIFRDRVSVLGFVTYITLFLGHDFWKIISTYKQQTLIPGMIVSGKTRAGKTTLLSIFKEGSGLSIDTRKFSIKSTTPQPLKQAGTDSFLLHLEEFTGDIQSEKETIIRDILNKSITAKGTITGENLQFIYRSSLILDGERLPVSQSVVNRTILIPMFEDDKKGNEKKLYDIKQYFFLPDLVNKALLCDDETKLNYFKSAEEDLINIGVTGRNTMLYSFLLAANNIIKIVDKNLLLNTIKENFNLLGISDVEGEDSSELFSTIMITHRIRPTIDYGQFEVSGGSKIVGTLTLSGDLMAEKRIDIINLIKKFSNEVTLKGYTLHIDTSLDSRLGQSLINYRQYFNLVN